MKTYTIAGTTYPSVTTILSATKPAAEQKALLRRIKAYDDMHGNGAWDVRMKLRAAQGTALHETASAYLLGLIPSFEASILAHGYWDFLSAFIKNLPSHQAIATELQVCNSQLGYAGTLDALIKFKETGNVCLLDFKTFEGFELWNGKHQTEWTPWRKSINKQKCPNTQPGWQWVSPRYKEALLQLTMYRLALEKPCHEAWVLVVSKTGVQSLPLHPWLWNDAVIEVKRRVKEFKENL